MKRIMTTVIFPATILLLLAACGGEKTIPDKLDWKVNNFEATDQSGKTISLDDLKGKVWIADFVFTSCNTVCPPMTANMAKLQEKMKEANMPVQFVSFTVDPERDKANVRKEFVKARGGDLSNWSFLGGYSFEYVKELSESSFKSALAQPPRGTDQFTHGTSFYLVNQEGTVVKKYSGFKNVPYDKIVEHAKILTSKGE